MLHSRQIACPYCGETFSTTIDVSGAGPYGELRYIEDCQVCCQPLVFAVTTDERGEPVQVSVARDDE